MSSSCRDRGRRGGGVLAALVLAIAAPRATTAANLELIPILEAGVETNTNRDLATQEGQEFDDEGYIAEIGADMRWASPRSTTTLRPLVKLQEYPDSAGLEGTEYFLDLRTNYEFQRGRLDFGLGYSHRDWFNAELPDAGFNPVNPDDPTDPATGQLREGESRDRLNFAPRYEHQISERFGLGGAVYYETSDYDVEGGGDTGGVDYDFSRAQVFASWLMSELTRLEVGPFASQYDAKDDSAQTDAYGVRVGLRHDWTKEFRGSVDLGYFEEETDRAGIVSQGTDSGWTANANIEKRGEVSRLRGEVGRVYSPSGRGGVTESDEFRVQYDRDWTARWSTMVAARYVQDRSRGEFDPGSDYDYWRGEISGKYFLTQKWYVFGAYRYTWRESVSTNESADNNSFLLRVGFTPAGVERARLYRSGN